MFFKDLGTTNHAIFNYQRIMVEFVIWCFLHLISHPLARTATHSWTIALESKEEIPARMQIEEVPMQNLELYPTRTTRQRQHTPCPSSTPFQQEIEKWAETSTKQLALHCLAHFQINTSSTLMASCLACKMKDIHEMVWSAVSHWSPN